MKSLKKSLKEVMQNLSARLGIPSLFLGNPEKKDKIRAFLIGLLTVFLVLLIANNLKYIRLCCVLLFFIILNFGFAFLKRKLSFSFVKKYLFGVEFIMVCTIATSIALGPKTGMIMGPILMIANYLGERRASSYFILTLALYSLVGYSAYFFRNYDLFVIGLIFTLIYNMFSFILSKLMGGNTITLIVFNIVNILFNLFMFYFYAPVFVRLLG